MSQGLGSLLSPKGKLVQSRLRLKYSNPRRTGFEDPATTKHRPRPSMPDMGRNDLQVHTSASERAIPSRKKLQRVRIAAKTNDLSSLAAEKSTLMREIAELQLMLKGAQRTRGRPDIEDLERRLGDAMQATAEVRREVDLYAREFQRIYKNMLQQDDFSGDLHSLKRVLEHSASLHPHSPQSSPRLPASLSDLLKRTYLTLSAWKRAVS